MKRVLLTLLLAALVVSPGLGQVSVNRSRGAISGNLITYSTTAAATAANTTETDLWSFSLPASTLVENGQAVRVIVHGATAANANTKTLRLYFGSTLVGSMSGAANNNTWSFQADVIRTGATTQQANVLGFLGTITASANAFTTPAETLSGAITIKVTGQNGTAAASDITFNAATVEFLTRTQGIVTGTGGSVATPLLLPDGTSAVPSLSFASDTDTGLFTASTNSFGLVSGGTTPGLVAAGEMRLASNTVLGWNATSDNAYTTTADVKLVRDAAAVLAQKNSTTAQTFRLYGTTTGPKYLLFAHDGSDGYIYTNSGGGTLNFGVGAAAKWMIDASGHFKAVTDNTYDIGASGAARPKDIWAGNNIIAGTGASLGWGASGSRMNSATDGVITLFNAAGTNFTSLQFGGGTSSFPELKRNSAQIDVRLADDSGYATLSGTFNVATNLQFGGKLFANNSAPTISSGFGTSPSVASNNGTAAFTINVGTGGAATSGVVGLPTATTGWNCFVNDLTAAAAHVAYNTRQTASTTTTATLENQTTSTGAAVAWAASDILRVSCFAY